MVEQNSKAVVTILWGELDSYESAKKYALCLYIHEWDGDAYYVGKAAHFRDRYISSYRHWVDGCLEHGAKLYIGRIFPTPAMLDSDSNWVSCFKEAYNNHINDVEDYLIYHLRPVKNMRIPAYSPNLKLTHVNAVPSCVSKLEAEVR